MNCATSSWAPGARGFATWGLVLHLSGVIIYRGLSSENRVVGTHYTIVIIRNPQDSVGNYLGPYIRAFNVYGG